MDKRQCKVKVVIRVRPPLNEQDKTCVDVENNSVTIFNHRNINESIQYDFSAVYGMQSTQQQIYVDCVQPLLSNALCGQNVSIFAYGPTGTGKTHTMLGTPTDPGIIPRVINGLFEKIEESKKIDNDVWKYTVTLSYLEIYNEKVQDLLEPSGSDLPIREDNKKNIFISGLAKKEIHNCQEFKMAFGPASNNRTVAATKLNEHSSRSHSIVQLTVTKFKSSHLLLGKIYLIDLAGSEDNRRTGNQGIRLKESGAINKSLFALGEVVDAINCGSSRIPYRNSKLTRLLQDSIGGTCHSVMITNIAPEERFYYDTYCTLNMATKSKKIVNNTVVKETIGIVKPVKRVSPLKRMLPTTQDEDARTEIPRHAVLETLTGANTSDSVSSLSPLMRRQEEFEETVRQRFKELENNLLRQMTTNLAGAPTPKTSAIYEMQKQLAASQAHLKELTSLHKITAPSPPAAAVGQVKAVTTNSVGIGQNRCLEGIQTKEEETVKGRSRKMLKRKIEEFTCSPLFATRPFKKKGFVSSACGSSLADADKENVDKNQRNCINFERAKELLNSDTQQKINEEFLNILNTSSIKELQSLRTVGAKRAHLIFDWRQAFGHFSETRDVLKIPGFTEKYYQKLLHSNFVTAH